MWGQQGYPWRPEYLTILKDRFSAGFQEADFASDPDTQRDKINAWASEKTRGKISELISPGVLTRSHLLVLANAIAFKGFWQNQFDRNATHPDTFTLADGTQVEVPMMSRKEGFRLHTEFDPKNYSQPRFQVAELLYRGDELSMVIILPGKPDGLPELESKLTLKTLAEWLNSAHEAHGARISLPKFRIETSSMMFKGPLQKLGMSDAFDAVKADFGGMFSRPTPLFLDFVVQKAVVEVNEEGSEAAAVTAVSGAKSEAAMNFRADRPFLFLIRDRAHGTILFMGRYEKP